MGRLGKVEAALQTVEHQLELERAAGKQLLRQISGLEASRDQLESERAKQTVQVRGTCSGQHALLLLLLVAGLQWWTR